MSNKLKKKKRPLETDIKQDSVIKEAWENMSKDFSRLMPSFLSRRVKKKGGKLWVLVLVTIVELIVIGAVGKLIYDWITS